MVTALPTATVTDVKWERYAADDCELSSKVEAEHEAVRDGERWLLPLSLLSPSWSDVFVAKERLRDVHFNSAYELEEIAEVVAPSGYELAFEPRRSAAKVGEFRVETSVQRTPRGATVRRRLMHEVESFRRQEYGELRGAVDAFRALGREILVFVPSAAPASGAK